MISYDQHYSIGKSHLVCQDYAIQGDSPCPFLILADGCSSSSDSDVGARILCYTAQKIVKHYWPLYQENDSVEWSLLPNYHALGRMIITEAHSAADILTLSRDALSATLLLAFLSHDMVHVYVYGDGCILLKTHNGELRHIAIEFSTNMPYYLNYWLDPARIREYIAHSGGRYTLDVRDSTHPTPTQIFNQPLSFSFSLEHYACVGIASDGMSSFCDIQHNQKLPINDVMKTLLDFKALQGEFVKRRVPKMLTRYAQEGIFPLDDLAVGVFASHSPR